MAGSKAVKKETAKGPRRIGLIEETSDNIYSVQFVLQSLGYQVACFSYRDDYLHPLGEFVPELIIVDMMIRDGGGFEVIRSLKGGALDGVPILAITADAMAGGDEDVYRAGGKDILTKPYSVEELQAKLRTWLT